MKKKNKKKREREREKKGGETEEEIGTEKKVEKGGRAEKTCIFSKLY
jgi:hypothetical protein